VTSDLASMFIQALVLSLWLISVVFTSETEQWASPCSLCSLVVEKVEPLIGKNQEEISRELEIVSNSLCSEIPEKPNENECKSFFGLYGPYIIEVLSSGVNSLDVCGHIGLCDPDQYKILWPTIDQNGISYTIKETPTAPSTTFKYKVFIADFPNIDTNQYALFTSVEDIQGVSISLKLTNQIDSIEMQKCDSTNNCNIKTANPGKRSWYYITVVADAINSGSEFTLNVNEKNDLVPKSNLVKKTFHLTTLIIITILATSCVLCIISHRKGQKEVRIENGLYVFDGQEMSPMQLVYVQAPDGSYVHI